MIRIDVQGVPETMSRVDRLTQLPAALKDTVTAETFELQRTVVEDKLSGQVLHARSGNLRRSITARVEDEPNGTRGIVGTNLVYARIHEFGGVIHVPPMVPVRAKALHWIQDGRDVFAKSTRAHDVTMPERSYLRSALADRRDAILAAIRATIARVMGR